MLTPSDERLPILRFDSSTAPTREAFDLWHDQMALIFDVEVIDHDNDHGFHGVLETFHLGSLLLGRCESVTQRFTRPPRLIGHSGLDHYLIQFIERGGSGGRMGGREMQAHAGDVTIIDLAQPTTTIDSDFSTLTLCIPREVLAPLMSSPDALHGVVLPAASPTGSLLGTHIQSLYKAANSLSARDAMAVARGSAAFVAGCLGPALDALDLVLPAMRTNRLNSIKRYIEDNLANPELDAALIAQAAGLSRPTLYRLFEPMGGVAAYVLQRRLSRAVADLMNPNERRRIVDIAHHWGFSSETAFSRAFRTAFGLSPRDARNARGQPRAGQPQGADPADEFKRWFRTLAAL
ncbi:helix-turn-helix domain-containing protein [Azospirillum soli]|uniref:AraC-like ligand-binding domain-containing protein n=1 Tax=Azospirillum soli TaxID=1304799 RepID=UPI001AEB7B7E|nr:helix-turn-helix domain-containing protein [Azospirillum soli]MBP2313018.1 AraC-like DNA-binding protein [Azospirillum soli]